MPNTSQCSPQQVFLFGSRVESVKNTQVSMPNNPSPQLSSEPEKYLHRKLTGSIWIQNKKYPYLFEPNGTCEILNHSRWGHYTISTDARSVFLTWTDPAYTEELYVLADGSFFLGGNVLVPSNKSRNHSFPCYPLPQPDLNNYQFEIDTGKMPNYGNITLDGRQVRLIHTGYGGNLLSDEVREFDSEEAAEEYYHSTIRGEDPYYAPGHINEPIYLELSDDKSHKFYEVTVRGLTVAFRYGRIGKTGQTDNSTYGSPRKAQTAAQKKINEKLKKGYVLFPKGKPSPYKSSGVPLIVKESSKQESIPYWLPEDFRVFSNDRGMVGTNSDGTHGLEERILPTVNQYTGEDGGYVAFYSRNPAKAVYSVGGGIYVVGQIRLKGRYIGRIFHPADYENQDISAVPKFKMLCRKTFGVEGWAGGDTGGWFAQVNDRPQAMVKEIAPPTTPGIVVTIKPGEDVYWNIVNFRPGSTVEIVAISPNSWFSFNLMAGENFAYHFNPRSNEGQIVQNTRVGNWGLEERLPFPQEMASGKTFTVKIEVQETQLAVHLNDIFLFFYKHRIPPAEIDSLRLICSQGSLQVVSVNISEPMVNSDLDITQFVRPAWKPIVTVGDGDRLASKFSGRPWLAINETWPPCPCCAEPLQLFVQLNLSQLPEPVRGEFGTGLLQMFHCMSNNCGFEVEEGTIYYGRVPFLIKNVRIRLVQPVGMGSTPPLPQIDGEDYGTYLPAKTITEWLEIEDYPDPDDLVAQVYGWERLKEDDLWDAVVERLGLDDLDDYDELYPTDESDKLGGYPRWVQGMECPGCPVCQAPMRQVFQLASEQNLNYAFGDLGIAHILQCKTHKDQFAFVWACG